LERKIQLVTNLHYGKRTKAIAFADDLLIALRAENVQEAENFANIEINKITNMAKENKITFTEQKSKFMLVKRRKRREITEVILYLNSKPLQQVKNIRYEYLRITIDNRLSFREHIISTTNKLTTLIHTLAKSAKLNWGLKQKALNTIYKGAILTNHAIRRISMGQGMEKNCNRRLYSRVQRFVNIKVAKAYRTTSNDALSILTANAPVELRPKK